jgi:hypothetical protein
MNVLSQVSQCLCKACGEKLVRSSVGYKFGYCSRSCWAWHGAFCNRLVRDDLYETRATRQIGWLSARAAAKVVEAPPASCIACGDTGRNSRGGECVPCRVNGRLPCSQPASAGRRGQLQLF